MPRPAWRRPSWRVLPPTTQRVGAEFLAGVPGTVGGALAMNAGCFGGETWNLVARVRTLDRSGELRTRPPQDFSVSYRHAGLRSATDEWFMAAWFTLTPGAAEASRQRIKELLEKRIASQPLQLPNCGSVFRNPDGDHAARLIEVAGLKGLRIGGAQVSEKHANFIVNADGAGSATDIERLIDEVQARVKAHCGVELTREVRIVGDKGMNCRRDRAAYGACAAARWRTIHCAEREMGAER